MPSVFKALATIAVWELFVVGLLTLVTGLTRIADAGMGASSSPELSLMHAYFAYGIGALFLSVLAMKLRKGGNSLVAPACAGVKAGFVRTLHPIRTAT